MHLFKKTKKHEGDNNAMLKWKMVMLSPLMCVYIHLMNVLGVFFFFLATWGSSSWKHFEEALKNRSYLIPCPGRNRVPCPIIAYSNWIAFTELTASSLIFLRLRHHYLLLGMEIWDTKCLHLRQPLRLICDAITLVIFTYTTLAQSRTWMCGILLWKIWVMRC